MSYLPTAQRLSFTVVKAANLKFDEITQELDTAQELVSEEQQEATVGRQLDEIDDQMRAWSRVSVMEKKLTVVEETLHDKKKAKADGDGEEDSDSDVDEEDLDSFNWRKKS